MITEAQSSQAAIEGFIRIFEDIVVQSAASITAPTFEPLMVVDLRSGMFQAFVLSLHADGSLYASPRKIEVEEAPQIIVSGVRTPMCAYRKKNTQGWVVCSDRCLKKRSPDSHYETVENIFDYMSELPSSEINTAARLLHAFLSKLTNTDSGQAYVRVVIVVDRPDAASWLEQLIPVIGGKLDQAAGLNRWQSAFVFYIDPGLDLNGFAFLTTPRELQQTHARYLLLLNGKKALEAEFDGLQFQYATPKSVELNTYDKIGLVGLADGVEKGGRILHIPNQDDFQTACLIGYLSWWLQIDEERIEELRQKRQFLEQALATRRQETQTLMHLLNRLKTVLAQIS